MEDLAEIIVNFAYYPFGFTHNLVFLWSGTPHLGGGRVAWVWVIWNVKDLGSVDRSDGVREVDLNSIILVVYRRRCSC